MTALFLYNVLATGLAPILQNYHGKGIETFGDAAQVMNIYSAIHAGYDLAVK